MKLLRTLLHALALFALPVHASVVLGSIGIEPDTPVTGVEDVVIFNLTGPLWGCSTANNAPICTAITFENVVLTVNGTALDLSDIAPGITETYLLPGGEFPDGSVTSLSLSATLSNTVLTDDLGSTYDVSPSLLLTGIATDGSLPTIAAPLALTSVPEASPLVQLSGLGLLVGVGAALRVRRVIS
jgi:hypothetical protein